MQNSINHSDNSGLRKRIGNMFLQFIQTPEFNPEAARFQKVQAIIRTTSAFGMSYLLTPNHRKFQNCLTIIQLRHRFHICHQHNNEIQPAFINAVRAQDTSHRPISASQQHLEH